MLGIGAIAELALAQFNRIELAVNIPSTTRAYAVGIDRTGSTVYWFFDAVTGQPSVDSNGNSLNPEF